MLLLMSPLRMAPRRLLRVRHYPLPFSTLCEHLRVLMSMVELQKLLMRPGQTKRQAVSSLKVPELKPSAFKPPRRPNAPERTYWGPVPEPQESVFRRLFLFICPRSSL
jgi:hypothetical protein